MKAEFWLYSLSKKIEDHEFTDRSNDGDESSNESKRSKLSEEQEIKMLQKLVKQRKDSAAVYQEQGREEMAQEELDQAAVIEQFLPEQLSEEKIEEVVASIIEKTGASGMQDMGKVMGLASQELAGKADGKTISTIVKRKLA